MTLNDTNLLNARALSIQQKFHTARFVIVASQHTHNYALKEKSKYCLYPKEHSTVEKGRWKTKGGGILFRVESL